MRKLNFSFGLVNVVLSLYISSGMIYSNDYIICVYLDKYTCTNQYYYTWRNRRFIKKFPFIFPHL